MKTIKRNDVGEETVYNADCPYCGEITDLIDYHDHETYSFCEHCGEEFEIED